MTAAGPKAQQKQRSREAIVAAAARFMRRQGVRGSSVLEVMKAAGLTVGGFYNHFDSKEQLFATAISDQAGSMWHRLLDTARGTTREERVSSVIGRYLSRTHRDNPESGCVLPMVAPEASRSKEGAPYREAVAAEIEIFAASFAELMAAPKGEALGLIALMYGALSLSRAVAGTPLSDAFLKAGRAAAERVLQSSER